MGNQLSLTMAFVAVMSSGFVPRGPLGGGEDVLRIVLRAGQVEACPCKVIRPAEEVGKIVHSYVQQRNFGPEWQYMFPVTGAVTFAYNYFHKPAEIGWWDNISYQPTLGSCDEACEVKQLNCGVASLSGMYHCNFGTRLFAQMPVVGTFGTNAEVSGGEVLAVEGHAYVKCGSYHFPNPKWATCALSVDGVANLTVHFLCKDCSNP